MSTPHQRHCSLDERSRGDEKDLYLPSFPALWHLRSFFLMLSGLMVIISPVMGDTINAEFLVTAEVTLNAQCFADFSLMLYSPLVCLASQT